ncbi:hypothetical protein F443_19289 [Phytophthora nicotianae P1569]|uniref:DUF3160 domain-containing protein n=1 Tax=Phytophthora nicotianae P1569 TaxID=1317065 RepID=V9E6I4_PHYNI|nr:hypothetical protein F443_19289 [Phytophthora nicotianae P1569]
MGGGDVGAAFAATLERVGTQLTSEDLVKLYPVSCAQETDAPVKLEDCKFFDLFAADPMKARGDTERLRNEAKQQHGASFVDQILTSTTHHPLKRMQTTDYRLKPDEKANLAANGVVAVERMPAESFADIYYRLYTDDMPVFVTADSILHAWHRSFDAFLVDTEIQILSPTLDKILESTLSKCCEAIIATSKDDSEARRVMVDVELFLRVGLSLLRGELVDGVTENTIELERLLAFVYSEETKEADILSSKRIVDFSQFKPRGHYTNSEELMRYFRAMMWLGTIDFRVAGGEKPEEDLYQLHCAVMLVHFLRDSQALKIVEKVDALISSLVADGGMGADSLSPSQLLRLLPKETLFTDDDKETLSMLKSIQNRILEKRLGAQLINGHPRVENQPPTSTTPMSLPSSFALLGQRFVWSSFIFSRLVFDHVIHNDEKQKRRIPSAVDIAFTLFGNDSAAQVLADRMNANPQRFPEFVPFRDGIQYSSNLVALRQVIDREFDDEGDISEDSPDEKTSISMLWQRALRALSRPSPNAAGTFHSNVWQKRQLNTQLASFTQLRHDTLLYAKQGYTFVCGCEYADGMVDPYPLFWQRMGKLAKQMEMMIERELSPLVEFSYDQSRQPSQLDFGSHQTDSKYLEARRFFRCFAETMQSIEEIAVLQAEHRPLSESQVNFLRTVMEERFGSGGSRYCGWYPGLFFESREDSGKSDVIVADVHTDSPSTIHGDKGGVLHLGVGNPLMAFFVVDKVMYAGPVFSSYEFVTPIDERLTDNEFKSKLPSMRMPDWAHQSYLC